MDGKHEKNIKVIKRRQKFSYPDEGIGSIPMAIKIKKLFPFHGWVSL